MGSIRDLILAVSILIGGGYAVEKIHNQVRLVVLKKIQHGPPPMSPFTSKMTGIDPKRIEQGYLD